MKLRRLVGFRHYPGYFYTNKITDYETHIYKENWNITLYIHQKIVFSVHLFHRPNTNENIKN